MPGSAGWCEMLGFSHAELLEGVHRMRKLVLTVGIAYMCKRGEGYID